MARIKQTAALIRMAMFVFLLGATPSIAGAACNDEQLDRDFEKIGLKSLEYILLPTPYRALCGHSIDPDIRFWESMIDHYGCEIKRPLANFLRHHWNGSIQNRRKDFEAFQLQNAEALATFCGQAGALEFPRAYSVTGLIELIERLAEMPALLPK